MFFYIIYFYTFFDNIKLLIAKWDEFGNRRKFFVDYAIKNKFDPLVPENWYSHPRSKIKATKVYLKSCINERNNKD